MKIYRIIDVEVNRVSEALRVLEDLSRFVYDNKKITTDLKESRHKLRGMFRKEENNLTAYRNVKTDHGLEISRKIARIERCNLKDIMLANFKRAEEGLRSMEEFSKMFKEKNLVEDIEALRYKIYDIEKSFANKSSKNDILRLFQSGLYGITDTRFHPYRNIKDIVIGMVDSGIKIIQYREKNKSPIQKLQECKVIKEIIENSGTFLIVNDDISIAMSVKASGIHLGQDDFPISEARTLLDENMIIGISTHSHEQALTAVSSGADYIGVGPVFYTETHSSKISPVGLEYLKWVSENIEIPYVAIGGIKKNNIDEILKNGGRMISIVSELLQSDDISEYVNQISEMYAK